MPTTNHSPARKVCANCRFMQTVEGGPEQIFFCKRKAGFEKRNWKIEPDASCPNFYSPQVNQAEIKEIEKTGAKVILLTQGKYAIVDADDYDRLNKYKWHASKTGRTWYARKCRPNTTVLMHRLITDAPADLVVDHINHNGLDNRKPNLRLCTTAQNNHNTRPRTQPNKTSKHKGVSFDKCRKRFCATIKHNYKRYFLGRFKSEINAAKAYDKAAKKFFGEFAYLNFP